MPTHLMIFILRNIKQPLYLKIPWW
uniref:Uncharacterized protein n=1 Tax=Rhizophora mucronata TaxID=61149 RepID=A0A2P2PTB3_RHIMU